MGVVNVTPDSFSDGGRYFSADAAVTHGLALVAEGADLVDVGGESTRPGAEPVEPAEEQRRVLPVIEALAPHVRVSIDTRNEATARAAVTAGATLVNDVSASLAAVAADLGVGWVAMHMLGDPQSMQVDPRYDDVVAEVRDHLVARAEHAVAQGVDEVWIDPGIGFGKTVRHSVSLLAHLRALVDTGFPVVVGASRKSSLGKLLAASDARTAALALPGLATSLVDDAEHATAVPADDRLDGSLVAALWAAREGAAMLRVHDVAPTVRALRLLAGAA
jgi:dihydropteroate synthase